MQKSCAQCRQEFQITDDDLKFYEKISPEFNGKKELVPPPKLCSDCRQRRRLAFRNERSLYHRKSDKSGKQIISMFSPEKKYVIYSQDEWWSDDWDARDYAMEFDFSKSFFTQFAELQNKVPRISLTNKKAENSEFCNQSESLKNCYLLTGSIYSENCLYGTRVLNSRDCVDCLFIDECELCYECTDMKKSYNVAFGWNCSDAHDARYIVNCVASSNLLFCSGLRHAQYQILNEEFSPEAFELEQRRILSSKPVLEDYRKRFLALILSQPIPYLIGQSYEDCSGNYIDESKSAHDAFDVHGVQDARFVFDSWNLRDAMDVYSFYGPGELCYKMYSAGVGMSRCLFSRDCWPGDNLLYCDHCFNCHDCFGSVGLRHKSYCILNKQYTKEEYATLVPKIIDHMRKDGSGHAMNPSPSATRETNSASGSWGEFWPMELSPFNYNETTAQEYFPVSMEEAVQRGYSWYSAPAERETYLGPAVEIPENIDDIDDSICQKILTCEATGKPYRIIPQELNFHRKMGVPLPHYCPDERHAQRMKLRNPRKLWDRTCTNCQKPIRTTYAPERPEIVYCEECYLNVIY